VIGPVEAAKLVPYLILKFRQVVRLLRDDPPDALLPIDFGGFNARLARAGKRLGIPVLYYFPPRSWAKEGRIGLGVAEIADRVATPFSWSAERLTEAGANAEWVGHPLLERAVASKPVSKLRTEFGCSEQDAVIAIFPGSRVPEIKQILPVILRACAEIQSQRQRVCFLLSRAANIDGLLLDRAMRGSGMEMQVVTGRVYDMMAVADLGITVSGTVTLEAASMGMPMVIVYTGPRFVQFLWKRFMNLPMVGMPNILLGQQVAPELIAEGLTVASLTTCVSRLLDDATARREMGKSLLRVRDLLGPGGAAERTAGMLLEMVKERRNQRTGEQGA